MLDSLPPEVLLILLEYLPSVDLLRVALTSTGRLGSLALDVKWRTNRVNLSDLFRLLRRKKVRLLGSP